MRKMLLHELHPSIVHAPLALIPTAVVADCIAVASGDRAWAKVGRRLWVAGTTSALCAGVAGLAASQEVKLGEPNARDMVFLHGVGNVLVLLAAAGLTAWRLRREPTVTGCVLGAVACGAAVYTASLGGKVVYDYGVGINPMPGEMPQGTFKGPPLLSREAPRALVRDAVEGFWWLVARTRALLSREVPLAPGAKGFGAGEALPPVGSRPIEQGSTAPRA